MEAIRGYLVLLQPKVHLPGATVWFISLGPISLPICVDAVVGFDNVLLLANCGPGFAI